MRGFADIPKYHDIVTSQISVMCFLIVEKESRGKLYGISGMGAIDRGY